MGIGRDCRFAYAIVAPVDGAKEFAIRQPPEVDLISAGANWLCPGGHAALELHAAGAGLRPEAVVEEDAHLAVELAIDASFQGRGIAERERGVLAPLEHRADDEVDRLEAAVAVGV